MDITPKYDDVIVPIAPIVFMIQANRVPQLVHDGPNVHAATPYPKLLAAREPIPDVWVAPTLARLDAQVILLISARNEFYAGKVIELLGRLDEKRCVLC